MSTEGNIYLVKDGKEGRPAGAMIHHRPACETPQVDLIWRLPQTYKLSESESDWGGGDRNNVHM